MNVLEMFEVQLLDVLPKFTGGALPTSKQGSKESSDRWVRADTFCHCTTKSRGESPRPTSPCHVEEASSTSCPQPTPPPPHSPWFCGQPHFSGTEHSPWSCLLPYEPTTLGEGIHQPPQHKHKG